MDKDRWGAATQIEAALFVPPEMAIEIVSTNWAEDYQKKVAWYAAFGVGEYWIVDPLALLSRYPQRKNPNIQVPTVSVGVLDVETRKYRWKEFTGSDRIDCALFPELQLTAAQVVVAKL
jgi:Uma2 family endonuclease